jgi:NAD(P)-dependent dehydrogenase (short-subunit alcohol dehydrogenase family)
MSTEINKKSVLITGAAGALGSELALQSALAGWEVFLLDKDRRGLDRVYQKIMKEEGVEPTMIVVDLAALGPKECSQVVSAVETTSGRLDALVHCAINFEGLQPLDQFTPQDWLRHIQVNLNAPWLLSMVCLDMLRDSTQASLFFVSEDMEKMKSAFWGAYGVSKSAIVTLANQMSAELSNSNILVKVINPGPMQSPLRSKVHHSEHPQTQKNPTLAAEQLLNFMTREQSTESIEINLG